MGGNLTRFFGQFVPTAEQLARVEWAHLGVALLQTLAMAILGTAAAILWSLPLSALAARGVAPAWLRRPIRLLFLGETVRFFVLRSQGGALFGFVGPRLSPADHPDDLPEDAALLRGLPDQDREFHRRHHEVRSSS